MRIYGENHAESLPTVENRALIIPSVTFVEPEPPSKPVYVSNSATSNSSYYKALSLRYKVVQTENGLSDSTAQINNAIVDYSANETLGSSLNPVSTTTITSNPIVVDNKNENEPFDLEIDFLKAGTNYHFKAKAKNTLVDTYSQYSDSTISVFTDLPGKMTAHNYTTLDIGVNTTDTVTNATSLAFDSAIYINKSGSQNVVPYNVNMQLFSISNPDAVKTHTYGFGKYIDGSSNLVNFKVYVNNKLRQEIQYHGFDITNNSPGSHYESMTHPITNTKHNGNTRDYVDATNTKQLDPYRGTANAAGNYLTGYLQLTQISNDDVETVFGPPSSTPYTLQYQYTRHSDVNSTNNVDTTHNIYVDDLPTDPTINAVNRNNTVTVKTVEYTMGIPSVETFDLGFERQYNNINSEHKYIRGDRKIGEVTSVSGTNKASSVVNVLIQRNEIDDSGTYTFSANSTPTFHNRTAYAFTNMYHTPSSILTSGSGTITISEKAYSLRGTTTISDKSITTNHYCDRTSYNGSSSLSRKFTTTFYEITDTTELAKLGSNLGSIGVTQYSSADHSQQIKDWTLLYINGSIQTNASQAYPTLSDFTYDGVTITNTYGAGTKSYTLDGTQSGDNSGYKWMVFNIATNSSYVKSASRNTGGAPLPYIDVPGLIDATPFKSKSIIVNGIYTGYGPQNVVGFIRMTDDKNKIQIGRFTSGSVAGATTIWYAGTNSENISLETLLHKTNGQYYGTLIDTGAFTVDNSWGVECPPSTGFASGSTIDIFIGIKNNENI